MPAPLSRSTLVGFSVWDSLRFRGGISNCTEDNGLKMNHNSSRDPDIILRVAEETGLHRVALHSPTD